MFHTKWLYSFSDSQHILYYKQIYTLTSNQKLALDDRGYKFVEIIGFQNYLQNIERMGTQRYHLVHIIAPCHLGTWNFVR